MYTAHDSLARLPFLPSGVCDRDTSCEAKSSWTSHKTSSECLVCQQFARTGCASHRNHAQTKRWANYHESSSFRFQGLAALGRKAEPVPERRLQCLCSGSTFLAESELRRGTTCRVWEADPAETKSVCALAQTHAHYTSRGAYDVKGQRTILVSVQASCAHL